MASCVAAGCTALSLVASPKPTCETALTSSFRCLPLKTHPSFTIRSRKMKLHVVKANKNYLVKKISGAELYKILSSEREKPVLVDFYAAWCGPCVILAQEIERLAVEFKTRVKFVKIDTDDEYELAYNLQVRGLPTVMLLSKDPQKNALRIEGILPYEVYRDAIQNELPDKKTYEELAGKI